MIIDSTLIPFEQEDLDSIIARWSSHSPWYSKLGLSLKVSAKTSLLFVICSNVSYLIAFEYLKLMKDHLKKEYTDLHNIKIAVYGQMYICGQITKDEFDRNISISLLQQS